MTSSFSFLFLAGGVDDDAMLQKALAMSMDTDEVEVNLEAMTEEEQIAYAMKMSMADQVRN